MGRARRSAPSSFGGATVIGAMTPVLAHFGHWWQSLLYLAPVIVVVGWLSLQSWRDNRRGDGDESDR